VNRDDLLKMLDLSGKDATHSVAQELAITSADSPTPTSPASLTALDLDDWGLRRGREVLDESPRLQALDLGEHAVADFFGCAFEPEPTLNESCCDPRRHGFVKQMLDTPEYHALHASTTLDQTAASIAAAAFAEQFARCPMKARRSRTRWQRRCPHYVPSARR